MMDDMSDAERLELQKLVGYGEIFNELLKSQIFKDLFEVYFTLTKIVDDSTKTVTFQVVENPPEVVAAKFQERARKAQDNKPLVMATEAVLKELDKARKR
jgi:hypothetical protein